MWYSPLSSLGKAELNDAMSSESLDIFVMCYNEASKLNGFLADLSKACTKIPLECNICIIDDGSTDGSQNIINSWLKENQGKAYLKESNQGIGDTLKYSYENSHSDYMTIIPADFEFNPLELPSLVQQATPNRVIVSYLRNSPPWYRLLITFCQKTLNLLLFGIRLKRTNWVKIIPSSVYKDHTLVSSSPIIETEVLLVAKQKGYKFVEVSSSNQVRNNREGGITFSRLFQSVLESTFDTFNLWIKLNPIYISYYKNTKDEHLQ